MNIRSLLIASGIAGVVMGVLGNLPIIGLLNCLLCAWVWGSAMFAVWLYRRNEKGALVTMGQGAVIGLVAGLIGAVVGAIVSAVVGSASAAVIAPMLSQVGDPDTRQMIEALGAGGGFSIIQLLISLLLNSVIGAIGGLLGAALFGGKPAAAAPPSTPPPSATV